MRDWYLTHVYKKLNAAELDATQECLQLPGEMMYVPENWWHATLQPFEAYDEDYSISVAAQLKNPLTTAAKLWLKAWDARPSQSAKAEKALRTLAKQQPENSEIFYALGQIYQIRRIRDNLPAGPAELHREERALNTSVRLSSERNCEMLNALASAHIGLGEFAEASRLLDRCIKLCGTFEPGFFCYSNKILSDEELGVSKKELRALEAAARSLELEAEKPKLLKFGRVQVAL